MTSASGKPLSLDGKVAIVTGAGGGLGLGIAHAFYAAGASVVLADISQPRLESAYGELQKITTEVHSTAKVPLAIVQADVTSPESVEKLFEAAISKFGHVDIVVNNAGVIDNFHGVGEMEFDVWQRVLNINLTGTFLVSKAAVNAMLKNGPQEEAAAPPTQAPAQQGAPPPLKPITPRGVILNVSSIAGIQGFRAGAAYTASKHAILGLTKNTAAYYGPKGIRCNAVLPGSMDTNIMSDMIGPNGQFNGNMEGIGIIMRTQATEFAKNAVSDVADVVLYLCSDRARTINGASITSDSGWLAA